MGGWGRGGNGSLEERPEFQDRLIRGERMEGEKGEGVEKDSHSGWDTG
jgi:hypothetical protein